MKTILAAALIALLALRAPDVGFAADEGEQAGSATETTAPEEKKDEPSDTMNQGAADDRGDTEIKTDQETKPGGMNVHRHRAGACPEGPPCPTD